MGFTRWLEAKGFDAATLTENQKAALLAMYNAEQNITASGTTSPATPAPTAAPVQANVDPTADIRAKAAAELTRISEIQRICASNPAYDPTMTEAVAGIQAKAVAEGWSMDKADAAVILATTPKTGPAIHASNREENSTVIEAALCRSAGLRNLEKQYKPETLEAMDRNFRNVSLQEVIFLRAQANGYTGRTSRIHNGNIRELLQFAFQAPRIQAGFSTVSLPGIFSNVANKFLLEGFQNVESTWRQICSIRPVNDFKTVTSYRLTGDMKYDKVSPDGKLKHGTVGEDSYTIAADTYGKIFSLTRVDIINDDLGAFNTLRQRLGRGGALKLNDVFWTEFLDNASFFAAGNGNYITGAGTVLGVAGLTAGVTKFGKLVDSDGNPMGSKPKLLLTPPDIAVTADELYQSTNVNTGGSATTEQVANANTHRGKYTPLMSAYLSNANFSGYSLTGWYLLADPADTPTIEVAFLNGQETPTVESAEADFDELGVQFRGYWDFGVSKKDPKGGVKSKGAA